MCENSSINLSDLGKQEPSGCRYIYGDPGSGDWHYCQRGIAQGGRPGQPFKPPYCARHTKVAIITGSDARLANYLKFLERCAEGDSVGGFELYWNTPVDTYMKTRIATAGLLSDGEINNLVSTGTLPKGQKHD